VECVRPGLDAIRRMLLAEPDLAILGVNSPDRDWEFCRRVLVFHDRPLLMLLSSGDKLDRVQGLELGADDCMLKPFLMIELVARVRALLCRDITHGPRLSQSLFVDGDLTMDRMRREVPLDGYSVRLTVTEFRMLACSVQYAGEVLSPKRLIAQVCGGGSVPRCAATSSCMSATLGRSSSRTLLGHAGS
jgi:DNA-binding response OmpR family regulator